MQGHQSISDLVAINSKCPRCSLCKFPPLSVVSSQRFSSICPSYREYKFHSHSGGGRVVMALSYESGRAELSDEARAALFACALCGGCDTACKYSSDIEVLGMHYAFRAESFEKQGPLPAQAGLLERFEQKGHFLAEEGKKSDWIREAGLSAPPSGDGNLLFVGERYALYPESRRSLRNLARLLTAAGIPFGLLGDQEPSLAGGLLAIGDRKRFSRKAMESVSALRKAGVRRIVFADPADLAAFRSQAPRSVSIDGIESLSAVEALYAAVRKKKLRFKKQPPLKVAWHDPCRLGRLSEPYVPWSGEIKKVMGQVVVYDPPRTVNRGALGCYGPPREIIKKIPGLALTEFHRKREYAFCCGGPPEASAGHSGFRENTAADRIEEALDVGAEAIATACPDCVRNLSRAAAGRVAVRDLFDVMAEALI